MVLQFIVKNSLKLLDRPHQLFRKIHQYLLILFLKVLKPLILDYILFYEVLEQHIFILTVWDSRRNPQQLESILSK